MTLKELGHCTHVGRSDRLIEFVKEERVYRAVCPRCRSRMRWDNWTRLHEPLRARCVACQLFLPSTELHLEAEEAALISR